MQLKFFTLEHKESWNVDSPLIATIDFLLDSGQPVRVGLNHEQVELLAHTLTEMALVQIQAAAKAMSKGRFTLPYGDNLLENGQ